MSLLGRKMERTSIDMAVAKEMFNLRILFIYNSKSPQTSDKGDSYGWLKLPFSYAGEEIVIEERSGIYGGPYMPSTGAPRVLGICSIGSFSYSYSPLPNGLKVGRYCSIAKGLTFLDSHHPIDLLTTSAITFRPKNILWRDLLIEAGRPLDKNWDIYANKNFPVLGHDIWIGQNVTLRMGIRIGNGAIVAANSVVTKDVPDYAIVGGNPAKIIRYRFSDDIVENLIQSEWWNLDPRKIVNFFSKPVERFLDEINLSNNSSLYTPRTLTINEKRAIISTKFGDNVITSVANNS